MPKLNLKLKQLSRDELYAEFEEDVYIQKRRVKDNKPMVDRGGQPIMILTSEPVSIPPETRAKLDELLAREGVVGMLLYVNMQMDSRELGRKNAVPFGPSVTTKDVETAPPFLNDLPSQRQYPQAVYYKPKPETEVNNAP